MRSNILSTTALLVAGLFAAVRADLSWNVLYTNDSDGRYYFLDSSKDRIIVSSADNVEAVKANHDKGQRFRWGGNNTGVTCQDHSKHFLGFDSGEQAFKSDFDSKHTDGQVQITLQSKSQAYLCTGSNCIGVNAASTDKHYLWYYQVVPAA
ncbi:uncharacterized protein FOMMEDRAFT_25170 [Fomitiporia mediterranea MF3/22]|uniref:uncharacterized protein n=1 Tax=Fomitiporia mediterranea (strain MF3/22) TaxID=694068 RepID=UPI000440744D|nr:uncharacterized protein FOMMEDRAFT_25170 [Fomitiporia mediterranea MF3/22]EJD07941.1 hypothetical protein FOMMEDRAFT_25170 [Fomitiporia mediterranea MF3/22]